MRRQVSLTALAQIADGQAQPTVEPPPRWKLQCRSKTRCGASAKRPAFHTKSPWSFRPLRWSSRLPSRKLPLLLAAISIVYARDWPDQRHTRSLYPWRQKRRRARDPGAHEYGVSHREHLAMIVRDLNMR